MVAEEARHNLGFTYGDADNHQRANCSLGIFLYFRSFKLQQVCLEVWGRIVG